MTRRRFSPTSRFRCCGVSGCNAAPPRGGRHHSDRSAANLGERELAARYGRAGVRLARLARGEDSRAVDAHAPAHTISAETTLSHNQADPQALARELWPRERLSARLKQAALAAGSITLKLKTADFRVRTRSRRIRDPTQLADALFHTARGLLAAEADGVTRFRLVGVGADRLCDTDAADPRSLFEPEFDAPRRLEHAIDDIRSRVGLGSVRFGRDLLGPGMFVEANVRVNPSRPCRQRTARSGTAFSLLPAENATGNWVEIVRRAGQARHGLRPRVTLDGAAAAL